MTITGRLAAFVDSAAVDGHPCDRREAPRLLDHRDGIDRGVRGPFAGGSSTCCCCTSLVSGVCFWCEDAFGTRSACSVCRLLPVSVFRVMTATTGHPSLSRLSLQDVQAALRILFEHRVCVPVLLFDPLIFHSIASWPPSVPGSWSEDCTAPWHACASTSTNANSPAFSCVSSAHDAPLMDIHRRQD